MFSSGRKHLEMGEGQSNRNWTVIGQTYRLVTLEAEPGIFWLNHVATSQGFLLAGGAALEAHHRPAENRNMLW